MTSNGAAGGTLEAMRNTLKLGSMNMDEINRGHEVLIDQLTHSNKEVKLSLANSLWAKQGLIFKAPFLASGKEQFGAEITSLDMASPKSPGKINGWVDKQTNGKIKDIVKAPLDAQTAMILLNAVYFNGNWESPFDKSLTKEQPFFQSGDGAATTDVNVNMMHKQGLISYAKGDGFQAVNLPYKGRSISMLVFLPDKSVGLDGFLDRLTVDNWNTWLKAFRPSIEELGLPRFQTTYELSLKKPLETIGMKTAFDPMHADFNNMLTLADNVYLSEVKHKAFIDVQEKGTEAAAATSVHAVGTSAPAVPTEPFQMEVDRPFFYAIYDSNTASILFMGSVRRPG
jgi:serpin B